MLRGYRELLAFQLGTIVIYKSLSPFQSQFFGLTPENTLPACRLSRVLAQSLTDVVISGIFDKIVCMMSVTFGQEAELWHPVSEAGRSLGIYNKISGQGSQIVARKQEEKTI